MTTAPTVDAAGSVPTDAVEQASNVAPNVEEKNEEGVRFTKWIPYTDDKIIPVSAKYVVTMTSLSKKMTKLYEDILSEQDCELDFESLEVPSSLVN